jgi:hypothetical protein
MIAHDLKAERIDEPIFHRHGRVGEAIGDRRRPSVRRAFSSVLIVAAGFEADQGYIGLERRDALDPGIDKG